MIVREQRRQIFGHVAKTLIYHLWYDNLSVWHGAPSNWNRRSPSGSNNSRTTSSVVSSYVDLLANRGAQLGEPYTRQLQGKLRELRFYLGSTGDAVRITYYIATGRRIILLTVFRKQRRQERAEIDRAVRAMEKCVAEGHTVEDNDE